MKLIAYMHNGVCHRCRPAEGARLAFAVKDADGVDILRSETPVPVDLLFQAWPVDGVTAEWAETENEFLVRVREHSVPADATNVIIIEESALPADEKIRAAWEIVDGAVVVNAAKADTICKNLIDGRAETIRRKYVPMTMVVSEYQQAELEAQSFKDAGYSGAVPASVSAWATAKGWTAQRAADDILSAAAMLRGKLMQIRAARLSGKEAVSTGTKTLDQVLEEIEAL